MSNRNFDSRVIIERLQNKNYARNVYTYQTNGQRIINNPQTSDGSSSRYNLFHSGAQTTYSKCLMSGSTLIDPGGICSLSSFSSNDTIPSAPFIILIKPCDRQLIVCFIRGSDGSSPVIRYEYSIDNGITWLASYCISSPIIIYGLVAGTTYEVQIRAINANGTGPASNMATGIPITTPTSPIYVNGTPGDSQLSVYFLPPIYDGGSPILNYYYSLDTILFCPIQPPATISPLIITGLTNGITYEIQLSAFNAAGAGIATDSFFLTPNP